MDMFSNNIVIFWCIQVPSLEVSSGACNMKLEANIGNQIKSQGNISTNFLYEIL